MSTERKVDEPETCAECGVFKVPGAPYHRCSFSAYYYGLDKTGDPAIDAILQAVAAAGKAYHNTEDWGEGGVVDNIQRAANFAAALRTHPRQDDAK